MAIYSKLSNVRKLTNSSLGSIIDVSNLNFSDLSTAVLEFLNNVSYNETTNAITGLNTLDVKFLNVYNNLSIKLNGVTTFNIDSQGRAEGNSFLVEVAEARRYRHRDFNNWPDVGIPGEIIYTGVQNQKTEFGEDFIGYLDGKGWVSLTEKGGTPFVITILQQIGSPGIPDTPSSGSGIIWIGDPFLATSTSPTTQDLYFTDENGEIFSLTQTGDNARGVTVDGEYVSGSQQTIGASEVLDIPLNFEYNLFTLNLDGTAIIDGDLNIIDDSCCSTAPTPASFGVFGISDTSGEFTYYSSLYDAMLAATSGDTIEAFASYTETTNEVILKDGVNVNFNGHTYTFDSSSNLNAFSNGGNGLACALFNGRLVRDGGLVSSTDSVVLSATSVAPAVVDISFIGIGLENPNGTAIYSDPNVTMTLAGVGNFIIQSADIAIRSTDMFIINGLIVSSGGTIAVASDQLEMRKSLIFAPAGLAILGTSASLIDSSFQSNLGISIASDITVFNSEINSFAGQGITGAAGATVTADIQQSKINSNGTGIFVSNVISGSILNNSISTFGGDGIRITPLSGGTRILDNSIFAINGTGISSTSNSANVSIQGNNVVVTRTDLNSSVGIQATRTGVTGEVTVIQNSVNVVVANLTAYALSSAIGSLSIFYLSNQLRSTAAPSIGPNVIQGQVNTIDNFGNIQLG